MTQEPTYSIVERDHDGFVVNIIEGLVRARAELIADSLRIGTAYTNSRPRTCEIEREPDPAEVVAVVVGKWLTDGQSLTRADHLVACLRHVADRLETFGDKEIPPAGLKVELHFFSHAASNEDRVAAVDELAAVFGLVGELNDAEHYHTGYSHGGGLRMVTIVEPKPEQKPLVSDETIAEAEQVGRMVPATDLHLPQADCGCPIKSTRDGMATFVDHCEACEVPS